MLSAGQMAREHGAWIQTHLSENVNEVELVRSLFPEADSYTGVYKDCGLLGPQTLLAHCIHLSAKEISEIAETGSIIAHCPTSNLFLGSGIFRMDDCLSAGAKIVLGSDVAGGPELNLWQVMRSALESQTARSFYTDCGVPSPETLLYFATQGAASAMGMGADLGSLDPGKLADLAVFDLGKIIPGGRKPNFEADFSGEEILTLLLYRGGPVATLETMVNGKSVYTAPVAGLL
jgi:guanine deaminase